MIRKRLRTAACGELGLLNFVVLDPARSWARCSSSRRGGIRRRGRAQLRRARDGRRSALGIDRAQGSPSRCCWPPWSSGAWARRCPLNAGRGIFQEKAPPDSPRTRARGLTRSVSWAPRACVGAPLFGALVEIAGPLRSCLLSAAAVVVVVALTTLFTGAARERLRSSPSAARRSMHRYLLEHRDPRTPTSTCSAR